MHNASFFLKYKLHHVFFWLLIMGLWFMLRQEDYRDDKTAIVVTLIKVADLALLVYITNYVLLPQLFYKKRYFLFGLIFLLMIAGSSLLKMQILGNYLNDNRLLNFWAHWKDRVYDNMIPHFFLVTAGAAIKLMFDYTRMQQRLAEVAKEKAETELSFLKSQINPHFLFNSLNAVYFLIKKDNPEARQALHAFSEMLRYQLYEMNDDKIPIEKEIRYLEDYMALQQLRKDEKYTVEFSCSEEVKGFSIEPLLLIPFLENAFKHISHYDKELNFVRVGLERRNGTFTFRVENSREEQQGIRPVTGGGIGLPNVKRRLELLYPGKHQLSIKETEDLYSVNLNLQLS
jgi:two-component system LytT family sensor kinase